MKNFGLGSLYIFEKNLSKSEINDLKKSLTVSEYDFFNKSYFKLNYYFETTYRNEPMVIIPKFYNTVYKKPKLEFENYFTTGQPVEIEMTKFPEARDPEQTKAVDFICAENSDVGVIKAYTGFGKTWCTIRSICNLKTKTLILVDKEKLMNQWIDEIVKFTSLTKKDIGILRGRESFDKVLDKPVVIGIIKTLASVIDNDFMPKSNKYISQIAKANFGLTILDEVHKTSTTPFFSKASAFFMSKKLFGLSATPKKSSKHATEILMSYFGNRIFIPDDSNKVKPKVNFIVYESKMPIKTQKWCAFGGTFLYTKYRKKLLESDEYNLCLSTIMNNVVNDASTTGVLVSGHEIKFLETLQEKFRNIAPKSGLICQETDDTEKENPVIFATYGSITAGLSINHLNKLIKATPISGNGTGLEQLSGRVVRDHNNKESEPEIFDLVDATVKQPANMAISRFIEYKRLGIEIKEILAFSDGKLHKQHTLIDQFIAAVEAKGAYYANKDN